MSTDAPEIGAVHADGVATIRFQRGETGNRLRVETLQALCAAIDAAVADSNIRAIVLAADGRHFSSGADMAFLDRLANARAAEIRTHIYTWFQGAVRRIWQAPKPTLALVNGAAVTVGCELALACDFRLAADDARFEESWIRLGLMAPLGGMFLLPRMVGVARAKAMLLAGRAMGAAEALETGLVAQVVTRAELDAAGAALAAELAALPPLAYAAGKEALHRALQGTLEGEWSAGVLAQAMLMGSADFSEGLAAFREKRRPRFTGS
jgi:enoyl-CoA hydratase/carnithine racemase